MIGPSGGWCAGGRVLLGELFDEEAFFISEPFLLVFERDDLVGDFLFELLAFCALCGP